MAKKIENSIPEIRAYLEDPNHPFKQGEFVDFWKALTEKEKLEFKQTELPPPK